MRTPQHLPTDILKNQNNNYIFFENIELVGETYNIIKLIQQQKQEILDLKAERNIDPNTKIYNKNFLNDLINKNENNYHVISIDIKLFKDINDTFGQDFGDIILDKVMKHLVLIIDNLDKKSYAIRNGGDEFILLINKDYDKKEIQNILQKINKINKNDFNEDIPAIHIDKEKPKLKLAFGKKYYTKETTLKEAVQEANLEASLNKSGKSREIRFLQHISENYGEKQINLLIDNLKIIKNK